MVRADGAESIILKEPAIVGGALEPLLGKVADQRILFGVELQKGDARGTLRKGIETDF